MNTFAQYDSSVPRYDELFNRAGMALNEAAALYSQFVAEILRALQAPISLPDIEVPVYDGEHFTIMHACGVVFDENERFPLIAFAEGMNIPLSDLSVVAADTVASHIYMEIKTADVYRSINGKD